MKYLEKEDNISTVAIQLYDYKREALDPIKNGCIL